MITVEKMLAQRVGKKCSWVESCDLGEWVGLWKFPFDCFHFLTEMGYTAVRYERK